jgi:hypothetical protein
MQDLDACNIIADTLYAQKERYKSISADKSIAIAKFDYLEANYKEQLKQKDILENSYKKEAKRSKLIIKIWKGGAITFGLVSLVETGYIALKSIISP